MEGNSGPRSTTTASAGSVKHKPANTAKRHARRPSRQLRPGWKKRVSIITMSSGIDVPTSRSIAIACTATAWRNSGREVPPITPAAPEATPPSPCRPWASPTTTGVPMAPNDTGLLSAINARTTAAKGVRPSATSNGAVIAAGVPKPAAPSRKAPNSQAIRITCARGSGEMCMKPSRIAAIAPLAVRIFSRRMAPSTIHRIEAAMITPSIDAASTWTAGTPQNTTLAAAVRTRLRGMAVAAGRRRMTSRPRTASSGVSAATTIPAIQPRKTRTGTVACKSTLCVTLPIISREKPRRPCEAMKMTSHFFFRAASTIPS